MRGSTYLSSVVLVAMLSSCAAASPDLTPSDVEQYQNATTSKSIELALPDSASSMKAFSQVLPLFSSGLQSLQAWGLSDVLFHATANNSLRIPRSSVAYMSCDPDSYPGNIDAGSVFDGALAVNVTAILLYSTTANYCNATALDTGYPYIYTMTNSSASQELVGRIDAAPENLPLHGLITYADRVSANSSDSGNSSQSGTQSSSNSLGASPTTAVAMIILYSITGIITALFLVIIITGAVRAHRHPERYGPRNVIGRPRQSRARGLGMAILDTIPIVKFGEQREPPKPTDVELGDTIHAGPEEMNIEHSTVLAGRKSTSEGRGDQLAPSDAPAQPRISMQSARSGIAPATNIGDSGSTESPEQDVPGCSICTENFELGQDLRVLPCDHQFHPACIDPWLLNVSGTCPLCRIDLNPAGSETAAEGENGELPPPIDGGDTPAPRRVRIGMRQSFLIGLGLGRVHDNSREDRLTVVRRMRAQLAEERAREAAEREAAAADEGSRRRRFRERFGIRTRRTGQEDETREERADAEPDATAGAERRD